MELGELSANVQAFTEERDWAQFHTVRSLILSIQSELGELAEVVQWVPDAQLTDDWIESHRDRLEEEVADVFIYLIRLSQVLNVDLTKVAEEKMQQNAIKYPVEKARGRADKYTEL